MSTYAIVYRRPSGAYLAHHGVQGQKWGVRKYQNADGSLTAEGYRHYYGSSRKDMTREEKSDWKSSMKADRNAWKANAKLNYKDAKKQVRQGTLDKESEEFQQAKLDRMMAKHGSKKNVDLYRYGSKADKEKAIKSAKAKKIGKTVTASVLGTGFGLGTVGSVAGIAAVGTIFAANALAGLALMGLGATTLGVAGVGLAGAKGTAARVNNETNNIEKLAYLAGNKQTSVDGTLTQYGSGDLARTKVNKADPTWSKDKLINALKEDISRHQDVSDQIRKGYTFDNTTYGLDHKTWMNEYAKRTDSIISSLKLKGVSQKEIDGIINNQLNEGKEKWGRSTDIDYKYGDRSSYQNFDNSKQTNSWSYRMYDKPKQEYYRDVSEMQKRWQDELHSEENRKKNAWQGELNKQRGVWAY